MEGFGVFQVRDKEECRRSVLDAIRTGYRLIDTAASYTNEDAVGEAVRDAIAEGICTREDLFITSKMWVQDMESYETAKRAIDASLEKSGLEYLDLYLLHQAMKDYFSAWRAMEDAYREGKLKAIGGQIILRWNVQRGVVVIPKSTHKERIEENFDIWDFTLSEEEMERISSLDMGYVGTAVKHFDPEFVRMCNGRKIHD